MSKSDVEMEDAERLHNDSGNNVQESDCKVTDPKVDSEEKSPCAASAPGDLNGGENDGDGVNKIIDAEVNDMNKSIDEVEEMDKSIDEVKDKIEVNTEAEDQTKPVNEASDPIKESNCGITIIKSDNQKPINTETPSEAQTAATSAVENLCDVKKEVVEHDDPESGVKEDELTKNDVLNENHGKDVEERPNEDVVEKPEEIAKDTCNTEYLASESMVENADSGDVSSENGLLPTRVHASPELNASSEKTLPPTEISASKDPQGNASSENTLPPTEISDIKDLQEHASSENTLFPTEISATKDPQGNASSENSLLPTEISATKDPQEQEAELGNVRPSEDEEMEDAVRSDNKQGAKSFPMSHETDMDEKTFETAAKPEAEESSLANQHEPVTPNALLRCSSEKDADHSGETAKSVYTLAAQPFMGEDDDGTPEDQAAFMKALEHFYRERAMDFKPPKFYGQLLNCLKLWRAVIRLGGYDRVTGSKLWRQVGESFHPPKTCTTVSWTFRIFYEKSLLEFERHKTHSGELQLPIVMLPEVSGVDVEGNGFQGSGPGSGSGPGRARRDSATRAMQGWHAQRAGAGEAGDPIIKEKNLNSMAKNEKNLKSISSLKQKRPNEVEQSNKAARTDTSKQLVASVHDVGPPADWVKISVRQTKDCFEVYALVPGLLREEVRVQSDPAGRLVITGQPEQVDNPWGITPFKKIINLPARIHPSHTSAVVSLHGRLYVRVPFEQPNI